MNDQDINNTESNSKGVLNLEANTVSENIQDAVEAVTVAESVDSTCGLESVEVSAATAYPHGRANVATNPAILRNLSDSKFLF